MLDNRRLDILQRFAMHGSIAAAAYELGYSASAVSQQLSTLEREVGVALIERTAHRANLTDAGREPVVLALPEDHPLGDEPRPVAASVLRVLAENETWLSTPAGQVSRIAGDERLAAIGVRPQRRWEFEGLYVLARLVATGSGIAL